MCVCAVRGRCCLAAHEFEHKHKHAHPTHGPQGVYRAEKAESGGAMSLERLKACANMDLVGLFV